MKMPRWVYELHEKLMHRPTSCQHSTNFLISNVGVIDARPTPSAVQDIHDILARREARIKKEEE